MGNIVGLIERNKNRLNLKRKIEAKVNFLFLELQTCCFKRLRVYNGRSFECTQNKHMVAEFATRKHCSPKKSRHAKG